MSTCIDYGKHLHPAVTVLTPQTTQAAEEEVKGSIAGEHQLMLTAHTALDSIPGHPVV